ncbi:MAG: urease accessory protein UreD [Bosea sp. (in: a-proteobacteria)]
MLQRLTPSTPPIDPAELPGYVRAQGRLVLELRAGAKGTHIARMSESGGFRLKFPRRDDGITEGIIVNTAGGMTGGDTLGLEVLAGEGASGLITTQAAEKIYRSIQGQTQLSIRLEVAPRASLVWAPQETILYDKAKLFRSLEAHIAPDARAVICESLVFGRVASGEVLNAASLRDRWRVRIGERLAFADDVRLEGDIAGALARKAVGDGARAIATVLLIEAGVEGRIDEARSALENAACQCAASALPGLIVARFLSLDADDLRLALNGYLTQFCNVPVPRSWRC